MELKSRPGGKAVDIDALRRKSWPGITAEFVRVTAPAAFDFEMNHSPNYLALCDLTRVDGETRVAGLPRIHEKDLRNKITFLPDGGDISGWSRVVKPASYVGIYLEPDAEDAERAKLAQLPPLVAFEDHMLRSTLQQFQAILHDPALDLAGYAETLATLLAFEMSRVSTQSRPASPRYGGLTARQARLVIDHIESHLTDRTTVSEMAALVNLSRFHFIRAFKQTVGAPPHQFVLRRRIEHAKEFLADPRLSIAEIAAKSGFNSVTQLTRAFRRIVGHTPTEFRRGL